ncbi:MAG: IscS subfamily cysteine desulfurase [Candidatus Latescibacteria bacterium]|nr:IscS subfamily cysteine desulfurase [Candidatus Latescibacterota bacterium]
MIKRQIYMDAHATTPVDPRVLETMLPTFTERFGNAASRHVFGWDAERAVDLAREQVAALIGASPKEIIFTSGATESNNLAIKGAAEFGREHGDHIVTQATEHRAVLDPCRTLERRGYRVTCLPVDRYGRVSAEQVREALTDKTVLVSIMAANNEVGTLQPVREIGRVCKEKGVLFHTDATQGVGRVEIHVEEMGIDLLSLSAHKIYGPKGVGALYIRGRRPRARIAAQMDGGGHERGLRSGTLNVPGIVGLGKACEVCGQEMNAEGERMRGLRDRLGDGITGQLSDVYLNGHPEERLPGNLNLSFAHVEGGLLLIGLKEIALSSGSACTSATLEPSHVLRALGVGDDLAHSSLRFGLGRFNTEEEVDYVVGRVVQEVTRLREMWTAHRSEGAVLKTA